jgi:hypothetical protein
MPDGPFLLVLNLPTFQIIYNPPVNDLVANLEVVFVRVP